MRPLRTNRPKARKASDKGPSSSMARTGLRGVRVGEAKNPGPIDRNLKMWSVNCRSFRTNGFMFLDEAAHHGVHLVAFQETNLTKQQCVSVDHVCRNKGWQLIHAPKSNTGNRGGVAVAVQLPFVTSIQKKIITPEYQTLVCCVQGQQRDFNVVVHYRHHSDKGNEGILSIIDFLERDCPNSWILALDSNLNVVLILSLTESNSRMVSAWRWLDTMLVSTPLMPFLLLRTCVMVLFLRSCRAWAETILLPKPSLISG